MHPDHLDLCLASSTPLVVTAVAAAVVITIVASIAAAATENPLSQRLLFP